MDGTVAVIGTGQLGGALLRGWVRSGTLPGDQLVCADPRGEVLDDLAATFGVRTTRDNREAVGDASLVVLAVKPQVLPRVLPDVTAAIGGDVPVVSLAAGVRLRTLEAGLPDGTPVIRVMSNTPVQVDLAMSVIAGGRDATDTHLDLAASLLAPVGAVERLDEDHFDAVTALSGSGPAYVFLVAEALAEAGVLQGLPRDVAVRLVAQTLHGAGALLAAGEASAAQLREAVTSPGGTTAAGLRALEDHAVRAALLDAVDAAAERSRELG